MRTLRLVRNSHVSAKAHVYPGCVFKNSSIGAYSYLAYFSVVEQTTIGRYCSIGMYFKSGLGSHPTNRLSTSPAFYSPAAPAPRPSGTCATFVERHPVTIGNDVWIGTGVTVLDGVSIGDGAVIGASCVITKDVAPYSIVVGVPGRPIGTRFDEPLVQRLLFLRWWDFDLDRLTSGAAEFLFAGEFTADKLDALERHCRECGRLIND